MSETINLYDAKTNLSKLVDRAAAGEEIVIAKAGKPKAKLVPLDVPRKERRIGGQNLLGITYMADDWDGPPAARNPKIFRRRKRSRGSSVRLLLDTHMFVWWDRQLRRVPRDLRIAIEDRGNQVFVSAASVWESRSSGRPGRWNLPRPSPRP
jgi:prevent-host-death family protein